MNFSIFYSTKKKAITYRPMFRLFFSKTGELKTISFFSNVNLGQAVKFSGFSGKNCDVSKVKWTTFQANGQLLQSSMKPGFKEVLSGWKGYGSHGVALKTLGSRQGSTWSRYNRYYGRDSWNQIKWPLLFTGAFCLGTTVVIPWVFQNTPLRSLKQSPQILVYSIIAVNVAVFGLWRLPQLFGILNRYGILAKQNIYSNWSILGSAFSHQSFLHLLVNMFVLQSFGTTLCAAVGVSNFLIMYLNSAVLSSFATILFSNLTRVGLATGSLGASGAIFSVVGTFSYLFPKAPVALFFIPIPGGAWLLFLATLGYNVAGATLKWGRYDYAAHIGGSLAGIGYGWWFDKKRKERRRRRRYI